MDQATCDRLVEEHFGYEASDDIDGVLTTFNEDIVHHLVGSPDGELSGKTAVRAFYAELFAALRGEHVQPIARWRGPDLVVDESEWTGTINDGRLLGHPGRAGRVTFRLLHVFELRDGRIATEKVWPDLAAIGAQLT